MLNPVFSDEAMQPRNILQVNFLPDNLGFLGSWLARRARSIQVNELGAGIASVNVTLPVRSPAKVLLPASASYMEWSTENGKDNLARVFGSSLRPRMLVAHDVLSLGFLSELCRVYQPDIVAVDSRAVAEKQLYQYFELTPAVDLVSRSEIEHWGIQGVELWTNELGNRSLRHSLTMFDNHYRRCKSQTVRVYDIGDLTVCEGVYPVESENGNQWAWTGPETLATILVPSHGNVRLKITLYIFGAKIAVDLDNIDIRVDGEACGCAFFLNEKIEISTGYLKGGSSHRLDIFQSHTMLTNDGSRQIGLALHKVKVESVT